VTRRPTAPVRTWEPGRIAGSFWTPERDERLRRFESQGLSAAKIAGKLGTTRGAVISRSQALRGLRRLFPYYVRRLKQERAERAARSKERKRVADAVLWKMREEIARGTDRNTAIVRARDAGVTLHAIAELVGLTRERVRQIAASARKAERR
jgi:hypothetical protein